MCNNFAFEFSQMPENNTILYRFKVGPPGIEDMCDYLKEIPEIEYKEVFYSKNQDVPRIPVVFADRTFKFNSTEFEKLSPFTTASSNNFYKGIEHWKSKRPRPKARKRLVTFLKPPPTYLDAEKWFDDDTVSEGRLQIESQIYGPTPKNKHGYLFSQSQSSNSEEPSELLIFSLEIHARTVSSELPDPAKHSICSIFFCVQIKNNNGFNQLLKGIICVRDKFGFEKTGIIGTEQYLVQTEAELIDMLIIIVKKYDPDVLCGYEIQSNSWGYLSDRMELEYELDMGVLISRILPEFQRPGKSTAELDEWNVRKQSSLTSPGRIFLNIWRLMRTQLTLTSYTIENCVFHVLHKRIPKFSQKDLNSWFDSGLLTRWRCIQYFLDRVQLNIELLDKTELVNQTCEFARVYGVDFFSAIIRGTQFKVEAMMCRIARPENFVMFSPSRKDVF
jgi:DNA polymerase zeta